MPMWSVDVIESRDVLCQYTVEARDADESRELAERGETVEEFDIRDEGVSSRSVEGKPERVKGRKRKAT